MRGFVVLAVLSSGAFWAFDAYEYDGRYSRDLWQQVAAEGQYFSDQGQHQINRALSGR